MHKVRTVRDLAVVVDGHLVHVVGRQQRADCRPDVGCALLHMHAACQCCKPLLVLIQQSKTASGATQGYFSCEGWQNVQAEQSVCIVSAAQAACGRASCIVQYHPHVWFWHNAVGIYLWEGLCAG